MKSIFILLIFLSPLTTVNAQMFSVSGASNETRSASSTFFRLGYAPTSFSYKGDPNRLALQIPLSFDEPAFNIGFESPVLSGSLNMVNKITGAEDISYFKLSIDYNNRLAFLRTKKVQLGLPVNLFTTLVNVEKEEQNNDFSQSTIGIGSGIFSSLRPAENFSFFIEGVPFIGFSNSNGGLFGGSNLGLEGKARINLTNIFPGRTLSFGYNYKYSSYDIDGEEFDYDLTYHVISIGISL